MRVTKGILRYPSSRIDEPGLVHRTARLDGCRLTGHVEIAEGARLNDCLLCGKARVGRFASLNGPNTDVYAYGAAVEIGGFSYIARNVSIQGFLHDVTRCTGYFILNHVFDEAFGGELLTKGPIVIGSDVWVGAQTVILPGACIGHGAVIAANSVVNSEVPPYAVAAGSPAVVRRYRFDDELVAALLELSWWDWPIERIRRNRAFFDGPLTADKLAATVD